MDFIQIQSYDIKEGRSGEFQEWLAANEKEFANALPDGVDYIGTYAAIYSSQKDAGSFYTLFRLDSYGAQDKLAAELKAGGTLAQLWQEGFDFGDNRNEANFSNALLKAVVDASVFG